MRYQKLNIPVDERVPDGHFLILAYSDGKSIIVPMNPCDLINADDHNCDWEGCSSVSHVFRCSPEQKYALERASYNKEPADSAAVEILRKLQADILLANLPYGLSWADRIHDAIKILMQPPCPAGRTTAANRR